MSDQKPIKLHLGCGDHYLEGYVNVDLPPDNQTVMKSKADIYQDIRRLSYANGSIDEIRTHHLFEHFTRQEALKLLFQWRRWLRPGGLLHIETPDFETGAKRFTKASLAEKFKIARHLFGSQESAWAAHKDFWGKEKFTYVLTKAGFIDLHFEAVTAHTSKIVPDRLSAYASVVPGLTDNLDNITVRAKKSLEVIDEKSVAREILSMSLIGKEKALLDVWLSEL